MSVLNIDTDEAREAEAILIPAMEALQRARQLLDQALPAVREAMDVMEPVQEAYQANQHRRIHEGRECTDDVWEAMRDRTGWGRAIDATFELLSEVQRVAY